MKRKNTLILSNKLYVPENLITRRQLEKWYYEWEEKKYVERIDEDGEIETDSAGNPLFDVEYIDRSLRTFSEINTWSGVNYVGLPKGNWEKCKHLLNKYPVVDLRPIPQLDFNLKLKKKVKKDHRWLGGQEHCVKEYLKHGYGVIKSDTGSGKTVIGVAVAAALGLKTIVTSKRKDGNRHWIKEFRKLTNINKLEKRLGKKLIGMYHAKNRKIYPITVATVQSFTQSRKGFKDLIKYQNEFGLLIADEVHELVTKRYSLVPASFNTLALCALTATEERVDKLHYRQFDIFGPVVVEGEGRQMQPTVTFIKTGIKVPMWIYKKPWHPGAKWNFCLKHLAKSNSRYDTIISWLHKDIDDGRRIVCISPQQKIFIREIAKRLRMDGYDVAYVDGDTKNRDRIYQDAHEGKYHVLCASKVMDALVNIESLDCLHFVAPLAKHGPVKQIYGRARREWKGKRTPIIRDYVDEGGQISGAYKSRHKLCEIEGWQIEYSEPTLFDSAGMSYWSPKRG